MLNSVNLQGRLTKDPEITQGQGEGGYKSARFSLAVDRGKDKNGNERPTSFVSCVTYGGRADVMQKYVHKGDMVIVSGELVAGTYTDAQGQSRYSARVIVSQLNLIPNGGRSDVGGTAPAPAAAQNSQGQRQNAQNAPQSRQGQQTSGRPARAANGQRRQQATPSEEEYYNSMGGFEDVGDEELPFY